MKGIVSIAVLILIIVISLRAQAPQPRGEDRLGWAFPVIVGTPPPREEGSRQVPGSTKTYTVAQIDDLNNPPDWFPEENVPKPAAITRGQGAVFACGSCHLMSGSGHPESADLTGFTTGYLMQQMADYKSGVRKDSANRMNAIAQGLSEEQTRQVSEWFAKLKTGPWSRVVEANTVPKTFVGAGRMRFAVPNGGTEPIGNRIITLPEDPARAASRDPHSGFIAYAPTGSVAKGEALVKNGGNGKTVACAICHADNFQGLGNNPRIGGLHPVYTFRQLMMFKNGERNGIDAALMKKAVAQLTEDDMIAVSAYLGTQGPR